MSFQRLTNNWKVVSKPLLGVRTAIGGDMVETVEPLQTHSQYRLRQPRPLPR